MCSPPPPADVWAPWLAGQGVAVRLITTPEEATQAIADILAHEGAVAFDIETAADSGGSALDPWSGYIRLAQFYGGGPVAYVFDIAALGGPEVLRPLADRRLVTFAGVFEAKFLKAAGLAFPLLDDAALAAGLRTDRDRHGRGDLATLTKLCTALMPPLSADKKRMQVSDFGAELTPEQLAYAAADVVMTRALWDSVYSEVSQAPRAYEAARGAILATAIMENAGLPFDREAHGWISDQWERIKANEAARFELMTSLKPSQRKAFSAWLEPKLAPEVVAKWPRTETGDLKMQAKRLRMIGLADAHVAVTQYLRATGPATLVSTFGHALAELVSPATQRLHFRLRIAGARTGRYTSSEPNGQNMPGGPFRRIFAARPGRVILSCDYAAVELRIAALLAGETTLFQVFREPPLDENGKRNPAGDPHVQISTELSLAPDPKLRLAKALNYGTIYGIGAPGFAVYAGISVEEAVRHLQRWSELRCNLVQWQRQVGRETAFTTRSKTVLGRVVNCLIPEKRVKGVLKSSARVSIQRGLNVPVQGSAAEAMLIAVAKVSAALLEAEIDAVPCVTVHDELVVEAAEDVADQAAAILERGMREGFEEVFSHLTNYDDVARFVVGSVERGPTWGGKRFDPQALSELDKEILFKGLDELAAVATAGSEDDDDDDDEDLEIVLPQPTSAELDALAAKADDGLDIPDFLQDPLMKAIKDVRLSSTKSCSTSAATAC